MKEVIIKGKKAIQSDWGKNFYYQSHNDKHQAERKALAHETLQKQRGIKKPRKTSKKSKEKNSGKLES